MINVLLEVLNKVIGTNTFGGIPKKITAFLFRGVARKGGETALEVTLKNLQSEGNTVIKL